MTLANVSSKKNGSKSAGLAAILSLLLPGAGQIYCGQDNKGVFLLGVGLLGLWSSGGITAWIFCPAAALDAFMLARKINGGMAADRWEFFPGVKVTNGIPTRVVLLAIVGLVATLTLLHIVWYAADYRPGG